MCVKLGAVQEISDHHNICLIVRVALQKKKKKSTVAKAHGLCRSILKRMEFEVFNVKLHLLSLLSVISTSERLLDFPANQKTNLELASTRAHFQGH